MNNMKNVISEKNEDFKFKKPYFGILINNKVHQKTCKLHNFGELN